MHNSSGEKWVAPLINFFLNFFDSPLFFGVQKVQTAPKLCHSFTLVLGRSRLTHLSLYSISLLDSTYLSMLLSSPFPRRVQTNCRWDDGLRERESVCVKMRRRMRYLSRACRPPPLLPNIKEKCPYDNIGGELFPFRRRK